jgi:hypothetical protein
MPLEAGPPETRTMRYGIAILLGALALMVPMAGSAAADHNLTDLVTVGTADTALVSGSSADGSRVYVETVEPLVSEDGDTGQDLYVFGGGVPTLLSDRVQAGPDAANKFAEFVGASADGSRVFFTTPEPLVSDDTDNRDDVYEWAGGTTTLISDRTQAGADASDGVTFSGNSVDGSRVFFTTLEQIVSTDQDNSLDLYERAGGVTTLVSDRVQAGADEDKQVSFGGVSEDGSHVFFKTAEALLSTDGDGSDDVYEFAGGTTKLLSKRLRSGSDEAIDASFLGVSADGSRVFFKTLESLVVADGDNAADIYERTGTSTLLRSDRVQSGADEETDVFFEGLSADGSRVFFETDEALLAADGDGGAPDVYERAGGTTSLISVRAQAGSDEAKSASFGGASADGSRVFFTTKEAMTAADGDDSIDVYERAGGVTTLLTDRVRSGADE